MRYKNDVAGGSYHRAEATYLLQKIQMYQSYDHGSSSNSSGSRDEKEREERMLQEVVEHQREREVIQDGIVIDKVTVEEINQDRTGQGPHTSSHFLDSTIQIARTSSRSHWSISQKNKSTLSRSQDKNSLSSSGLIGIFVEKFL
jgi:hypothetical protein